MTTFRSEEGLVGLFAIAVVAPWIAWTLSRGIRDGRLPISRGYVAREERPGAYKMLLCFYLLSAAMAIVVALDLLFGVDVRFWL